jgi:hypothetical protein
MLDSLKPKLIVVDGNNYKSLIPLWKKSCIKGISVFIQHLKKEPTLFVSYLKLPLKLFWYSCQASPVVSFR